MTPEQHQLKLLLDDVVVRIPWEGRSPRELTRVQIDGIFKAGAAESVREFVDPAQLDLWRQITKASRVPSLEAPSLLPLPKRWR